MRWRTGDQAAARPLFERALSLQVKAHGAEHPEVAASLLGLAFLLRSTGDYAGAKPLFERALAIQTKAKGGEHLDLAATLAGLSDVLRKTGNDAGARPPAERALAIREKALGAHHLLVAESHHDLGALLHDLGDLASARDHFLKAAEIRRAQLDPEDPLLVEAERQAALLEPLLRRVEGRPAEQPPPPAPAVAADTWFDHYTKGEDALKARRWKEAIDRFAQALAEKPGSEMHARTQGVNVINYLPHLRMGIAYFNLGQYDASLRELEAEEKLRAVAGSPTEFKNLQTFRWLAQQERLALPATTDTGASPEEKIETVVARILSRAGTGTVQKIVPAVVLANAANAVHAPEEGSAAPVPEERVSSPAFVLSGLIVDDQPDLKVTFLRDDVTAGQPPGASESLERSFNGDKMGDLYSYHFAQSFDLPAGVTVLKVIVNDTDGLSAEAVHKVNYSPPWLRSPWPYTSLALLAAAALGGRAAARIHRRRSLMKRRFNPYIAGAPILSDDLFFGREALLARILDTIHNNSILVYGERRIGKTTLQHQLKKRLQQLRDPMYDFYPVYVDLQGTSQDRFFSTLAEEIFDQLAEHLGDARPWTGQAEGAPYNYEALVRDIHTALKALQKRGPRKVKLVLLVDEIDELNAYDPRVSQKLRALFMKSFAESLVAVVSGVSIKKDWSSLGSPWYNFFEEIKVEPFSREDARALIERPIRGIFQIEDGVVTRIVQQAQCRPYLIQKICILLVSRMHEQRRRRITVADVEAVANAAEA